MKLSGLLRVAIAVSVSWLLALGGFITYEHQNSNPFCAFGNDGAVCQHVFWSWVYVAPEKFLFTLRLYKASAFAFCPIAALWFLLGATLWVRSGFDKQ